MKKKKTKVIDLNAVKELINGYEIEFFDEFTRQFRVMPMNSYHRNRELIIHRQIVFDFLFNNGYTKTHIGFIFDKSGRSGPMDHATVVYGIKTINALIKTKDKRVAGILETLTPMLAECVIPEVIEPEAPTPRKLGFNTTEIAIMNCETVYDLVSYKAKLVEQLSLAQINGKR